MSRTLELMNGQGFPAFSILHPVDGLILKHYGACQGGHTCQVFCEVEKIDEEIYAFCEKQTDLTGWLMKSGMTEGVTGGFYWVTFRPTHGAGK